MSSHWKAIEELMREIGATRTAALALDARDVGTAVVAEIDSAISKAAAALDAAIGTPDDDAALTVVCEAIVVAREQIEAVRGARERAGRAMARSVELRRRAAQALLESIRRRHARKP